MTADELMIGNYLIAKDPLHPEEIGKIIQIGTINESIISEKTTEPYDNSHWIKYIEPIPLTEEWLVKFGFESHQLDYFTMWGKNKQLVISQFDKFYYKIGDDYSHEIHYVHQLQNLFKVHTHENLTL